MKLEDQVCTIEQAKRLNELCISQESLFFWYTAPHDNGKDEYWETNEIAFRPWFVNASDPEDECDGCTLYVDGTDKYSAFTVAELGELLPGKFKYQNLECFVSSAKYCKEYKWIAGIHTVWAHDKPIIAKKYFTGDNEAQVRAGLLIHLLESKSITAEEVNQRLLAK